MYSVHCTLYSVQCTMYMYNVHVQCTCTMYMYNVQYKHVIFVHCTSYNVVWQLFNVKIIVVLYTLYSVRYTM